MKKVKDTSIITNNDIVGVKYKRQPNATVICIDDEWMAVNGNDKDVFSAWTANSQQQYVKEAIEEQQAQVYLFSTYGELWEWLISAK